MRSLLRPTRGRVLLGIVAAGAIAFAACQPIPPPPPGQYVGLGFDTCAAPSAGAMNAWGASSPYHSVGIYIGGDNAACLGGNLTSSWVSTVASEGWRLAPLYVGDQAPCNPAFNEMPAFPGAAYTDGLGEGNSAVADAAVLGLGPGTPIYFDLEAYNCGGGYNGQWIQSVIAFVSGWTASLHIHGYVSGLYSSSASGIANEATYVQNPNPPGYWPDAIWFANWNNSAQANSDPFFSNGLWVNARLHQYAGGHYEGWGGVVLNIDSDFDNGPLAG